MEMHAGQHSVDVALVQCLLLEQFPSWSRLPIEPVVGSGTVNAIFRIGTALAARFPLVGSDPIQSRAELEAESAASIEMASVISYPTNTTLYWRPRSGLSTGLGGAELATGERCNPKVSR
ncbi:hypothetical protein J7E83_12795 [Arthrobacter sp. ISL-48]|uniref:hypothetical protein n=1 Tax=Arthrobacter sp. ISL-48 TaxID=2819110 RepID=UPI001BE84D1B|nr:hypothetical protein [Arthrobacter sp. ISL-48]MBT2532981.1 hypothetical protein [Arthrobacter sp. ISL-48]